LLMTFVGYIYTYMAVSILFLHRDFGTDGYDTTEMFSYR
jgi:hypothetical protein